VTQSHGVTLPLTRSLVHPPAAVEPDKQCLRDLIPSLSDAHPSQSAFASDTHSAFPPIMGFTCSTSTAGAASSFRVQLSCAPPSPSEVDDILKTLNFPESPKSRSPNPLERKGSAFFFDSSSDPSPMRSKERRHRAAASHEMTPITSPADELDLFLQTTLLDDQGRECMKATTAVPPLDSKSNGWRSCSDFVMGTPTERLERKTCSPFLSAGLSVTRSRPPSASAISLCAGFEREIARRDALAESKKQLRKQQCGGGLDAADEGLMEMILATGTSVKP